MTKQEDTKTASAKSSQNQHPTFSIEPFDPERHDRESFTCGVAQVDNFFKKTANKLMKAGNSAVYVMVAENGEVAGFYAMNAHAIHFENLPAKYKRTAPNHGAIPAVYISMIGRDVKYRGQKIGEDLLIDALCRASRATKTGYPAAVIMLDVLDCGDAAKVANRKAIYENLQFQSLASDPLRMFMPMKLADELRQSIDGT
ncbi:MAG: hypothetical protein LRY61_06135 [Burkholderiaceae bacterium]|nr:hypothetical protein [Burkholderiaceae bacterium]